MLVDAGPDPDLVDSCLRRTGISALDLIVITHFHADHVDGLPGALRDRGRPPIVVSPLRKPADQVRGLLGTAASARVQVVTALRGMSGQAGTGEWAVRWRLLPLAASAPSTVAGSMLAESTVAGSMVAESTVAGSMVAESGDADGTEINNSSVVVFAEVQGLRVMALGDVEPEAQRPLARTILTGAGPSAGPVTASGALAPVDVVVVSHHGSARQERRLYSVLRPRVALIGVGADNDYGHPAPSALALLRQVGALSLRTDQQGQLAVSGPPDRLRVVTSK